MIATFNSIEELMEFVDEPTRRDSIPFLLQFFASLLFFGHRSYQTVVGEDLNIGMSQSAISRAINKVSLLISTYLLPRYVKFPSTADEVRETKQGFINANLHFPGAITNDPVHPAIAYINRKGFHSINVQAIIDANSIITNINVQYPGSTHDAAIWSVSTIQRHMKRIYMEGRRNCYLLGDSGYPIQPWLMTPFPNLQPNSPEEIYNHMHRQARNTVERGFGGLKARFRCLRKDRVLHYSHIQAAQIICSGTVLHNICRKLNLPLNDDDDHNAPDHVDNEANIINDDIDELTEGRFIRGQVVGQIQEMFE